MWNDKIERMPRKEIIALQTKRLQWSVNYTYENVPYFHTKMQNVGVRPENIHSLDDIRRLPFTTKDELQQQYPFNSFAVPREKIARLQGSSGTKGKPTIVAYTRQDMKNWAELVSRVVVAAGVNNEDVAQIAFGYGLFTGASGLDKGLTNVGVTVVPLSSGNTERQLMMMQDLGTTVLVATPSYALHLAEQIEKRGLKEKIQLRIGLLGSEPCTPEMKRSIEEKTGMRVTDNYGLSEMMGPGIAGECTERSGLHLAEDHYYAEIIDPDTLEVLPPGERGELVLTSLTKEAMPVIRYRTGDITYIIDEPCACGRTHRRIGKIQGRVDDMVIIKGVNVFPSQIAAVLEGETVLSPHFRMVLAENRNAQPEILVEVNQGSILDQKNYCESLSVNLQKKIQSSLGLRMTVKLLAPETLERNSGKTKYVIDQRQ